jgi:hypothetical protein
MHPPAAVVRQYQRDTSLVLHFLRDLDRRQSELLLVLQAFVARYQAPDLHAPVDQDVAEAAAALAATYETSARGVIYEHRPAGAPAARLASALRPIIAEAGSQGGSSFERDAAVVLRRLEASVREAGALDASNPRAYLDLLGRVLKKPSDKPEGGDAAHAADAPGLILP